MSLWVGVWARMLDGPGVCPGVRELPWPGVSQTQVVWDVWGRTQVGILALPLGSCVTLAAKFLDFVETQFHGDML